MRTNRFTIMTTVALIALALIATGCAKSAETKASTATPEGSVLGLLQLRSELSTDAAQYEKYLTDPKTAAALAASVPSDTTTPPIPKWESPFKVVEQDASKAKVRVVWVQSKAFPGWTKSTIFLLQKDGDKWLVEDAVEETSTAAPKKP